MTNLLILRIIKCLPNAEIVSETYLALPGVEATDASICPPFTFQPQFCGIPSTVHNLHKCILFSQKSSFPPIPVFHFNFLLVYFKDF